MKVSDFTIEPVPKKAVDAFIKKWHYSQSTRGLHISHCFGLYSDDGPFGLPRMIGAMIYGIPAMYGVAERYYKDDPSVVIELNRLCCIDDTPTNTESYFIGYTLRWLRDNTKVKKVISYADETYNQWFNSPGHYKNMFSSKYKTIGIGYVQAGNSDFIHYWTTDFAY